jgi:hypothetical protein
MTIAQMRRRVEAGDPEAIEAAREFQQAIREPLETLRAFAEQGPAAFATAFERRHEERIAGLSRELEETAEIVAQQRRAAEERELRVAEAAEGLLALVERHAEEGAEREAAALAIQRRSYLVAIAATAGTFLSLSAAVVAIFT